MTSVAAIERELAILRDHQVRDGVGLRTNILDLVVYAGTPSEADEAGDALARMERNRPSRALICLATGEPEHVTAESTVFCTLPPDGSGPFVCADVVRLDGPGPEAVRSMVTSLLLPDLPVFLVWLAPPDFDRPLFRELCVGVTRLVTDAARFPGTLDALPALSRRTIPRLTDLAWTELTGWRELVAQLFDIPDHAALLPSITEIRVRHHAGSDAQARLLAGWIESRTGRGAQVGLEPVDASVERPGALEAVEIVCGDALFRVERQDEDIAVMTSPELPDQHRTLPVLDLPELLAAELDVHDADPVFVEALAAATDLWR